MLSRSHYLHVRCYLTEKLWSDKVKTGTNSQQAQLTTFGPTVLAQRRAVTGAEPPRGYNMDESQRAQGGSQPCTADVKDLEDSQTSVLHYSKTFI